MPGLDPGIFSAALKSIARSGRAMMNLWEMREDNRRARRLHLTLPGLDPGIIFGRVKKDRPVKPGDDEFVGDARR